MQASRTLRRFASSILTIGNKSTSRMVAFQPPPAELVQSATQTSHLQQAALRSRSTSTIAPQTVDASTDPAVTYTTSISEKGTQYHTPVHADNVKSTTSTSSTSRLKQNQPLVQPPARTASPMLQPAPRFEDDPGVRLHQGCKCHVLIATNTQPR